MLYLITHKILDNKNIFCDRHILLVGAYNKDFKYEFNDNEGDNISQKNHSFCELTGLYYLWKNTSDDYVGIEHYRRMFSYGNYLFNFKIIKKEIIENKLKENDLLLPYPYQYKTNLYNQYKQDHYINDLLEVKNIIQSKYPDYRDAFDYVFNSNECCLYNMMVIKRKWLNDYCSFLFGILFCLEEKIQISDRNEYQKRVFGFLSERLLNVWVKKNEKNLNIGYMNVSFLDNSPSKEFFKQIYKTVFFKERIVKQEIYKKDK